MKLTGRSSNFASLDLLQSIKSVELSEPSSAIIKDLPFVTEPIMRALEGEGNDVAERDPWFKLLSK